MVKCIIDKCTNHSEAGIMKGDLCLGCYEFLKNPKINNKSTAARNYYKKSEQEEIFDWIRESYKKDKMSHPKFHSVFTSYQTPAGQLKLSPDIPTEILYKIIVLNINR